MSYGDCCHARASSGAAICGECGSPLIRCLDHLTCGQLLGPEEHCAHHVRPSLTLPSEELPVPTEGEVLGLTLRLSTPIGSAPLERLQVRWSLPSRGEELLAAELGRTRMPPGSDQLIHIDLPPLPAGRQRLKVQVAVHARIGGQLEAYVFESAVGIRVASADRRSITINNTQNIDNKGATFAAGAAGVVQTGDTHDYADLVQDGGGGKAAGPPVEVGPLRRNRTAEAKLSLRGYAGRGPADEPIRVGRGVELIYAGFQEDHVRPIPRPFLLAPTVRCGRNSTSFEANPNHLRLLQGDPSTGAVDATLSRQISGLHFELNVQHDRLNVVDRSTNGTWVNRERLETHDPLAIGSGDELTLLQGMTPTPLRMRFDFQVVDAEVRAVTITRLTP